MVLQTCEQNYVLHCCFKPHFLSSLEYISYRNFGVFPGGVQTTEWRSTRRTINLASTTMPPVNAVQPTALKLPGITKLKNKRVVLASNSPRRREILKSFVRFVLVISDSPLPTSICWLVPLIYIITGSRTRDISIYFCGRFT